MLAPAGVGALRSVVYACPACRGELAGHPLALVCMRCGSAYPLLDGGVPDFAGSGVSFDEWWLRSPEERARWAAQEAPKEAEFQRAGTQRFILPLLRQLQLHAGAASVLSAGCGVGADVDILNEAGYSTWGIDLGHRAEWWPNRRSRDRLARATVARLPFPDAYFDLVLALDLLEHIGVVGDTTQVTHDYQARRLEAVHSLLRVTRPGGYVLLTGVNRRFPVDPFHRQSVRWLRVHSPLEHFSLSFGDIRGLALSTGLADTVQALPLRGFFNYSHLRHNALFRPALPALDWLLGGLPRSFYASWLSFFTIVLVRRRPGGDGN